MFDRIAIVLLVGLSLGTLILIDAVVRYFPPAVVATTAAPVIRDAPVTSKAVSYWL